MINGVIERQFSFYNGLGQFVLFHIDMIYT